MHTSLSLSLFHLPRPYVYIIPGYSVGHIASASFRTVVHNAALLPPPTATHPGRLLTSALLLLLFKAAGVQSIRRRRSRRTSPSQSPAVNRRGRKKEGQHPCEWKPSDSPTDGRTKFLQFFFPFFFLFCTSCKTPKVHTHLDPIARGVTKGKVFLGIA